MDSYIDDFNIDLVLCIEASKAMIDIADDVKLNIKKFLQYYRDELLDVWPKCSFFIRVKFILFKDYGCCPEAMIESEFMNFLEDEGKIYDYIDNIEFKGGYGYCNALEALVLALKSNWTTGGRRRRHITLVYSKSKVHPLGIKKGISSYPAGMPSNLEQLIEWWNFSPKFFDSTLGHMSAIIAFTPAEYPWVELENLWRYWPAYSPASVGLNDVDIQCAVDLCVDPD